MQTYLTLVIQDTVNRSPRRVGATLVVNLSLPLLRMAVVYLRGLINPAAFAFFFAMAAGRSALPRRDATHFALHLF